MITGDIFAHTDLASLRRQCKPVLGRDLTHIRRGAAFFIVVVDLSAGLVRSYGHYVIVFPVNVEVTVHKKGLTPIAEVIHQAGDELKHLVLRAGVRLRGVH